MATHSSIFAWEILWQRSLAGYKSMGSHKISWRKEWQPTPVFLPGEFHGQRSLAGYSLWGHKESDMSERLILYLNLMFLMQNNGQNIMRNFSKYFKRCFHCPEYVFLLYESAVATAKLEGHVLL